MEKVFATFVIGLALLLGGCALSHDKFYYDDGDLCADLKSFVLGTGEAEKYVIDENCEVILGYDTKDTGISDNATELGGEVAKGLAEGAVKGIKPGL
jgi:hypothetical protein